MVTTPRRTLLLRIEDPAVVFGDEAAIDPWDVAFAGDGYVVAASMLGEVNQVIVLRSQR